MRTATPPTCLIASDVNPVSVYYCKAGLKTGMVIRVQQNTRRWQCSELHFVGAEGHMAHDNAKGKARRSGARCVAVYTTGVVTLMTASLLEGEEPQGASMPQLVTAQLRRLYVNARMEHPGAVTIPTMTTETWTFGTVNETWGGDLMDDKYEVLESVRLTIPSDHQSDGRDVALAILAAIGRAPHRSLWPKPPLTSE